MPESWGSSLVKSSQVELAHVRSPNRQEAACILDEATSSVNGGLLAS